MTARRLAAFALLPAAAAQMAGTLSVEAQPAMPVQQCKKYGGCWQEPAAVTMDMNWRWLHNKDAYNNCLTDAGWDEDLCPDGETCSRSCALEGVDAKGYGETYKAAAVGGNGLKLTFPDSPRVYMTEGAGDQYKVFKLKNREFTFDVDLSTLPCGMNAALYFIEMPGDGGRSELNQAGAKYGTGYCDAQCPHGKFIKDKANLEHWEKHKAKNPDGEWVEVGPEGRYGICCAEMDILEANREAGAYTAHPCKYPEQKVCQGDEECGNKEKGHTGWCDKDGCGFASYRMGAEKFWGVGDEYAVDTSKPMTIVTQFITSDNTDTGDLVEIKRLYIQEGKVIENSKASLLPSGAHSITDDLCSEAAEVFNASSYGYGELGGLKAMGEAIGRGMVLSMSIWDDDFGRMLWLDAEKGSADEDEEDVGIKRGPCPFDFGADKDLKEYTKKHGAVEVTFSGIKYGEIGSTYSTTASGYSQEFEVVSDRSDVASTSGTMSTLPWIAGLLSAMVAATAAFVVRSYRAGRLEGAELIPDSEDSQE